MSTTIDQRVVEMRFDNKQFERNVSDTMSTLEKLKQKLNFNGAAKGLENVNTAANNVNMAGLSSGVQTVTTKFSALQVMGVTALANITNSAVNAGKRIVSALTIDPVTSGFQEYETQINSVQTILANTESKGTTISDVNQALEELNKYADQTIYNFTEMTRNIGTFTAAGVDLNTSVAAIKGIANLAAVSGSTSQQASTAMYQLSQALATGTVKLQDWNSVVNAGMGGEVFQNALIRTAAAMDGASENVEAWRAANIDSFGSFRDSLTQGGWLTTDVLTETLNQFTMAAEEGSKEWEAYKQSLMETGYTEKQAEEILKMANTATDAATKVKTFTQLWDVLKESAQSGWGQTWKLIIGDFEEAKGLLTPLADTLTGFINRMSDFRNRILEIGLNFSKPWTTMMDKLGNVKRVVDNVGEVTDKLEFFQDVVSKVWRGDYKNSDTGRYDLLEKAGYDHRVVQDLVNKGHDYKLTVEDIEASHKKFGLTLKTTREETEETAKNFEKLSDEKLKDAGLTKDEIALYRAMEKEADRLGISVSELADKMSETDGRSLLMESFANIGDIFVGIGKAAKQAWIEVFNPPGAEVLGIRLYGLLESFKSFTESLRLTNKETGELTETGDKIMRTFKGVFAVLDIVTTVVGGVFKVAFKVVTAVLGKFGLSILDVTAIIGDSVVKVHDWIESILNVSGVVDFLIPILKTAAKFIGEFITAVKNSKWFKDFCDNVKDAADGLADLFKSIPDTTAFQNLITALKNAGHTIREWFETLKDSDSIPRDIIAGLVKGITSGIPAVLSAVIELARGIITGICDVLGIASPSKAMIAIGGFIIWGLIKGMLDGEIHLLGTAEELTVKLWDTIKTAAANILDWIKNIDLGTVIAVALTGGMLWTIKKVADALETFAKPLDKLGDMFESIGGAFNALKKQLKASAWEKRARAVFTFALAIGVLATSVYVLAKIEPSKLWNAVGAIAALAGVVAVLAFAVSKMGGDNGIEVGKFSTAVLAISGSLYLVARSLKLLAGIDSDAMLTGINGLVAVVIAMIALMKIANGMTSGVEKVGGTLFKMSVVMIMLISIVKLASSINAEQAIKGGAAVIAFIGIMAAMMHITKLVNKDNLGGASVDKVGGTLIKMAITMMLMIAVIKLASGLDASTVIKGGVAIAAFIGIMAAMIKITQYAGNTEKLGRTIFAMASSMMIMALVVKLLGGMSIGSLIKGTVVVAFFAGIVAGLVAATNLVGPTELKRVSGTILAMSLAIGIMAVVAAMLSILDLAHLAKGVTAVGILGGIMTAMIWATRGATDCKSNLIVITVAIGLLAASAAALSLIDTSRLLAASAALSLLLGMFAVIIKSSSTANGSIGTLIVMAGVVAVLAGILYILASLPIEASLSASAALSTLLLAMSASLTILSMSGPMIGTALTSIGVMTGIIAALGVILVCLSGLPVESTLATAASLTTLLLAMVGALAITSIIGPMATTAVTALGIMTGIVAALGVILLCLSGLPVESTLVATASLSTLLVSMAAVCALVSFIPAAAALNGALGLASFVGVMAVVLAALGGLMLIPGVNELMSGGGKLLGTIGYAIGNFVGSIIGGLSSGVTSGLPDLGTNLSMFMNNAGDFITGITQLNPDLLTRVKTFADAIDVLSGAAERSAQSDFSKWLFGDKSIATFSGQLETVGTNISAFVSALTANGAFTEDAVSSVKVACEILNAMAEAANSANGQSDWSKSLFGDNSLTAFSSQFGTLGTNLSTFVTNLTANGTFDDNTVNTVRCAGDAIKALADVASTIPNEGGWAAALFGDNSLSSFSKQFGTLGTNLSTFVTNLTANGTFDDNTVNTIRCAGDAIKALADASSGVDGQSNWAKKIFGDNSLSSFSSQFGTLGSNLKAFVSNLGEFGKAQVDAITSSVKAITAFSKLANADLKGAKNNLEGFGSKLSTFGENISSFCSNMPSSDSIDSAVAGLRNILSAVDDVAEANTGSLSTLAKNLKQVGSDAVNKFVSAFTSNAAKTDVKNAADVLADKAVDGLDGLDDDGEDAGKDLGSGLVKGINSKSTEVYWAGYALGAMAVQGEKDGQKSNSPSKLTIQAGKWLGEGLVIGIDQMGKRVYKAGYGMGDTAVNAISSTVSRIAAAIDSDIDVQPTIRPVMDLSNVKTGADMIGDLFASPVGTLSTVGRISASMNARSQNGSNSEVVSAINKLRKDLGNVGGTSYTINGLSYSGESDLDEAFKTIVRHAKIERRV